MPWSELLILAALAALVTPLAVSYIPRTRQSPAFDFFLWVATFVMGFLGAWFVLGYWLDNPDLAVLDDFVIADVPIMPPLVGAAIGALILNGSLWVLDRFHFAPVEEEPELGQEERRGGEELPVEADVLENQPEIEIAGEAQSDSQVRRGEGMPAIGAETHIVRPAPVTKSSPNGRPNTPGLVAPGSDTQRPPADEGREVG